MSELADFNGPVVTISGLLNKKPEDFQREDLLTAIEQFGIRQLNLCYAGLDGKLKELKVPVNDLDYIDLILAQGERLDGSSVFKGIVDTSKSDLYVLPIYKTAFISPFDEATMGIFCRFLDCDGELASYVPENILYNAHNVFKEKTGHELNALGELEFYLIYDKDNDLFTGLEQRGYHQAAPFSKCSGIVDEMLQIISAMTGAVKYAHAEVGYIENLKSEDPEINGKTCEQFEIEFLPRAIEDMAYYLLLAKWIVRNVAFRYGCSVTFSPKLEEGMAGSGLHFHLEVAKNGKNVMEENGQLSEIARKLIGGLCKYAPSIQGFGNSVSSAYLRLVANQEAPTRLCWSESNRNALIRVPLGWRNVGDMGKVVNSGQKSSYKSKNSRQTVEIRSPDGSAFVSLTLAAITASAIYGLTSDDSLKIADDLYVKKITDKQLEDLPDSCASSSDRLVADRALYESDGLFPTSVIDYVVAKLRVENDRDINKRYSHLPADKRLRETRRIMHKDLHKH